MIQEWVSAVADIPYLTAFILVGLEHYLRNDLHQTFIQLNEGLNMLPRKIKMMIVGKYYQLFLKYHSAADIKKQKRKSMFF